MSDARFDVVGIGNAIVDVVAQADEAFVRENGLVKGAMTLIDEARANELYALMPPGVEMSGGSADGELLQFEVDKSGRATKLTAGSYYRIRKD